MGFDPQLRSISPSASFHETSGTSADAHGWVWKVAAHPDQHSALVTRMSR